MVVFDNNQPITQPGFATPKLQPKKLSNSNRLHVSVYLPTPHSQPYSCPPKKRDAFACDAPFDFPYTDGTELTSSPARPATEFTASNNVSWERWA